MLPILLAMALVAAPLSPVSVQLANATQRAEKVRISVYARENDSAPRTKVYKTVLIQGVEEHPEQQVATVPVNHLTEVCLSVVAYPSANACRTFRQTAHLKCRLLVGEPPYGKVPLALIVCS